MMDNIDSVDGNCMHDAYKLGNFDSIYLQHTPLFTL